MELGEVLLVGGTGYLGSHLAKHLGLPVIARSELVEQSRSKVFDTVIHAAHFKDLQAEKEFIASLSSDCYFVFFSSAAVYGNTSLEGASVEDEPAPINDYGRYKLELEKLVQEKFPQHLILRISNPYGGEPCKQGVYQIFKSSLERGEAVKIFADKPRGLIRDFISIDEFLAQVKNLLETKKLGIHNISSGSPVYLEDFAKNIDKSAKFEYLGSREGEISCSILAKG